MNNKCPCIVPANHQKSTQKYAKTHRGLLFLLVYFLEFSLNARGDIPAVFLKNAEKYCRSAIPTASAISPTDILVLAR